jgi:3-isopropylmalate/(R)-2-methylmalate dehydratase large subunit
MAMTMTEKVLAAHAGRDEVSPGELIDANIDIIMGHDLSCPEAIEPIEGIDAKKVFDPDKIVLVLDHFTLNKDIKAAESCKRMREFAKQQGTSHYYE